MALMLDLEPRHRHMVNLHCLGGDMCENLLDPRKIRKPFGSKDTKTFWIEKKYENLSDPKMSSRRLAVGGPTDDEVRAPAAAHHCLQLHLSTILVNNNMDYPFGRCINNNSIAATPAGCRSYTAFQNFRARNGNEQ